jgi:hypothetical protein
MSFEALIAKVRQAEATLEARERQAGADARQLAASWRQLWSPGRLLLAGLGGGFAIGLLEPGKHAASGRNTLQMLTALAGLIASGSAQLAAGKAEDVADNAGETAAAALSSAPLPPAAGPVETAAPAATAPRPRQARTNGTHPDTLRRSGHL